ncbi:hypothetical protein [Desulfotomaculum copahuensis]|uniref:Uncharacterized protein n=1 Tax=Desulfotomaculum copahuensis TaxID=1838280 RepID=A0A1B7LFY8_9FIRM|nr:hypothetical protein [Desulfotomaculum copahuensis]OAT83676.1 hypothetical protein A6M21_07515 [Desulfotomaculum copahuensis]
MLKRAIQTFLAALLVFLVFGAVTAYADTCSWQNVNGQQVYGYYTTATDGTNLFVECDPFTNKPDGYAWVNYQYTDYITQQIPVTTYQTIQHTTEVYPVQVIVMENPYTGNVSTPEYSGQQIDTNPGNWPQWNINNTAWSTQGGYLTVAEVQNPNPFPIQASVGLGSALGSYAETVTIPANGIKYADALVPSGAPPGASYQLQLIATIWTTGADPTNSGSFIDLGSGDNSKAYYWDPVTPVVQNCISGSSTDYSHQYLNGTYMILAQPGFIPKYSLTPDPGDTHIGKIDTQQVVGTNSQLIPVNMPHVSFSCTSSNLQIIGYSGRAGNPVYGVTPEIIATLYNGLPYDVILNQNIPFTADLFYTLNGYSGLWFTGSGTIPAGTRIPANSSTVVVIPQPVTALPSGYPAPQNQTNTASCYGLYGTPKDIQAGTYTFGITANGVTKTFSYTFSGSGIVQISSGDVNNVCNMLANSGIPNFNLQLQYGTTGPLIGTDWLSSSTPFSIFDISGTLMSTLGATTPTQQYVPFPYGPGYVVYPAYYIDNVFSVSLPSGIQAGFAAGLQSISGGTQFGVGWGGRQYINYGNPINNVSGYVTAPLVTGAPWS